MIRGKKYSNKDVVYVSLTKHFCPNCGERLRTVKVSKVVNYHSPESENFDFSLGSGKHHMIVHGDVKFIWKEFECPKCSNHFTVEELKKIEGIEEGDYSTEDPSTYKRNRTKDLIIFFIIAFLIYVIITCLASQIKKHANLENSTVERSEINKLRSDYDLGTCRILEGNVSVFLFYMDDFESSWTPEEITNFTNDEVKPGLAFLEKEAKQHGIKLNLNIKQIYSTLYYDGEVIISIKQTGLATVGVLNQAADSLNYSSDLEMITDFKSRYQTEVVCFTIFNKNGTAYAINPPRGETEQIEEHCIIFAHDLNSDGNDSTGSQSSVVAHEVLHLFGAEDFYTTSDRKSLAKKHYPSDIMLSAKYCIGSNNIGDATAFYIGWTDKVPDVLYNEKWF